MKARFKIDLTLLFFSTGNLLVFLGPPFPYIFFLQVLGGFGLFYLVISGEWSRLLRQRNLSPIIIGGTLLIIAAGIAGLISLYLTGSGTSPGLFSISRSIGIGSGFLGVVLLSGGFFLGRKTWATKTNP